MKKMYTTLLLIVKNGSILLAEKKRGFGEGKFNGVGGKVEAGETIEHAMLRETKEEIGGVPVDYEKRAEIHFDEYVKGERALVIMNLYVAQDCIGEPQESEEMKPQWFVLDKIPYDKMFPDDTIWLPEILKGKKFKANFKFDEKFNLLSHSFEELK